MSPAARYVGQGHIYDNQTFGPLTDKRIERYIESGYYGNSARLRLLEKRKYRAAAKRRQAERATQRRLEEMFVS
jgi:hypothetical protein